MSKRRISIENLNVYLSGRPDSEQPPYRNLTDQDQLLDDDNLRDYMNSGVGQSYAVEDFDASAFLAQQSETIRNLNDQVGALEIESQVLSKDLAKSEERVGILEKQLQDDLEAYDARVINALKDNNVLRTLLHDAEDRVRDLQNVRSRFDHLTRVNSTTAQRNAELARREAVLESRIERARNAIKTAIADPFLSDQTVVERLEYVLITLVDPKEEAL